MSAAIPYVSLIPADCQVAVPKVVSDWKYAKSVEIDNIGCPTQIDILLDQDGCDVAPLLYVRLRGGSCTVYFCPSGEHVRGDPLLYETTGMSAVLTTAAAFKLFEIIIPLAQMAMALHKRGVALTSVLNTQYSFPAGQKRERDVEETEEAKRACPEAVVVN